MKLYLDGVVVECEFTRDEYYGGPTRFMLRIVGEVDSDLANVIMHFNTQKPEERVAIVALGK